MEVKQHEHENQEHIALRQMQRFSLIILIIILFLLAAIIFFLFDPSFLKNENIFPNQSGIFVPLILASLSIILSFMSRRQSSAKAPPTVSAANATNLPLLQLQAALSQLEQEAPFHVNEPLSNSEELFGREYEYNSLIDRITSGTATCVVGRRKIGKTWLIEYLKLQSKDEIGRHYYIAHLAATQPSCSTVTGFVKTAFELFACADLIPASSEPTLKDLKELAVSLTAKNIVPVLCIDEFEGFGENFDIAFFRGLRQIAYEKKMILVISSTRTFEEMRGKLGQDARVSEMPNVFKMIKVRPFDETQVEKFLEKKREIAGFKKTHLKKIKYYSQEPVKRGSKEWLPLRLQLACQLLWKDLQQARQDEAYGYRPDNGDYWSAFEQRLEHAYRGIVPPE